MYRSLGEFMAALESAGELHRVKAPVSPLLEIAALADRECKKPCPTTSEHARLFDPEHCDRGGKALLFENVEGCDFPVLINAYGSFRRTEMALGCTDGGFGAIGAKLGSITKPQPPKSFREILAKAKEFWPLLKTPPKRVTSGACQEVVKLTAKGQVDLQRLPLIKCWPLDGDPTAVGYPTTPEDARTAKGQGRYLTFAGIHTIHADDEGVKKPSSHNIGMYRLQLIDETHLAMHWHMHHDGAAHWRSWKKKGKPMPVAICLGGESVMPYAATAPLPPGISELLMAGFLNGKGIQLVRAQTVPLWVPANSEIVIEGFVSTDCGFIGFDPRTDGDLGPGAVFEGPFGDHTGFYSLPDRYPVVDVTAVTHRVNAVYPTTIVGLPPQEDYYLGKATERVFLPLLKTIIHDIVDYHLPLFGCFHNCAFVQIRKEYPLQARRVMCSIWGAGQMAWTKVVIVVDEDVDVHDEAAVWRAVFANCDFKRDLELVNGPLDILDHASPRLGAGHKLGIDATRKMPGEEVNGVPVGPAPGGRDRLALPISDLDLPVATANVLASHDIKTIGDLVRLSEAELLAMKNFGAAALREVAQKVRGVSASSEHVVFPAFGHGRCAFVGVDKRVAGDGARGIFDAWALTQADFVVAVGAEVDLNDADAVLFHWMANWDPGRDTHVREHRVGFDATPKIAGDERNGQPVRDWPPLLAPSDDIARRIEERWSEYGFAPRE